MTERPLTDAEQQTVANLRQKFPKELMLFGDRAIASVYSDFSMSEDAGNNDRDFPRWFDVIGQREGLV
jgi:hypothetical protein